MNDLLEAAIAARENAYAPYSNFKVGAAIGTTDRSVFAGCNVENAAYPLGQCAEGNAIAAMVSAGGKTITGIVVVGQGDEPCMPCGGCRQRLAEFAKGSTPVLIYSLRKKVVTTTLGDLLPQAFGPSQLGLSDPAERQDQTMVLEQAAQSLAPRIALILGSGLGAVVDDVEVVASFPFAEIQGFPRTSVSGHAGRLVLGRMNGTPLVVLQGRVHLYEGHSAAAINGIVRTLKGLGVRTLIVTNAAGGIRADLRPGTIALIDDHINFMGTSPLIGPNDDEVGPRFLDMSRTYDARLRTISRESAERQGLELESGIYLGTLGPAFETPAEIRAFRALGADMVGMSTVPEVISARHAGMRVLGFSIITNPAAGLGPTTLSHEETLLFAKRAGGSLCSLLREIIPLIEKDLPTP